MQGLFIRCGSFGDTTAHCLIADRRAVLARQLGQTVGEQQHPISDAELDPAAGVPAAVTLAAYLGN